MRWCPHGLLRRASRRGVPSSACVVMREGSGAGTGPPELMPNRACINGTQPAGPQAAHRLPVLLTGASMHCSPMGRRHSRGTRGTCSVMRRS